MDQIQIDERRRAREEAYAARHRATETACGRPLVCQEVDLYYAGRDAARHDWTEGQMRPDSALRAGDAAAALSQYHRDHLRLPRDCAIPTECERGYEAQWVDLGGTAS